MRVCNSLSLSVIASLIYSSSKEERSSAQIRKYRGGENVIALRPFQLSPRWTKCTKTEIDLTLPRIFRKRIYRIDISNIYIYTSKSHDRSPRIFVKRPGEKREWLEERQYANSFTQTRAVWLSSGKPYANLCHQAWEGREDLFFSLSLLFLTSLNWLRSRKHLYLLR